MSGGHGTHAVSLVWFVSGLYVPWAHGLGPAATDGHQNPAGQTTQLLDPGAGAVLPAAQARHAATEVWFVSPLDVPAAQATGGWSGLGQ